MNSLDAAIEKELFDYINSKYDIKRFNYEFINSETILLYSEQDVMDIKVIDDDVDFIESLLNASFVGLMSIEGKHGFVYKINK